LDESRKAHLQAVLKLQESLVKETQKDIGEMVVGKASTTAFSDNAFSRNDSVKSMEDGMTNSVVKEMGG
jgi:hypothetical protein